MCSTPALPGSSPEGGQVPGVGHLASVSMNGNAAAPLLPRVAVRVGGRDKQGPAQIIAQ